MAYLLDTNVFVNAKHDQYGFDFCPAFWDWLDEAHAAGRGRKRRGGLRRAVEHGDELSEWARARRPFFRRCCSG